ncbi:hypothetical protein BSL78_29505 [Apostichopus japonicus]|uniref:Sushi domain-containing protein n=1 Tax=Stichopus japonicus TaxID=307972 RepID=A0A2G8JD89_STIJA|nr:hypothetical protein BSL78_29505 [Apostichopus japonicus]
MCNPVSCGHPPNIINGYIMTKDHTYGSLLTYGCVPGYNLVSHGKLRCAVDRSWKGDVPSCEPVNCGIPPSIYNGKVDFNQTTYKERAFYFCNNGFDLIGSGMHKCLATGAWSNTSPSCQPVFCGEPRQVINGEVHGKNFTSIKL